MRNWINIVEGHTEPQILEEKINRKALELGAAAAFLGGMGYNLSANETDPMDKYVPVQVADEIPPMEITDEPIDDLYDRDRPEPIDAPLLKSASKKTSSARPVSAAKSSIDDKRAPVAKMNREEGIKLLALTMWGEARSDGVDAMRAVGHVVMNRIRSERQFGRNIKEVVWKRKAFSCWNPSDPNREAMKKIASLPENHPSRIRWDEAVKIAKEIVAGQSSDPTAGSLFYHTKQIKPYWVGPQSKPTAKISNHIFYRTDQKAS